MKRTVLIIAASAGLAVAMPAMALQNGGAASHAGIARETIPLRVKDDQVAGMQQKLNDQGFDAGQVDGFWGPNTAAALRRYQAKNGLQQTGRLDPKTLEVLGLGTGAAAATVAQAGTVPTQAASLSSAPAAVATTAPGAPLPATPAVNTATGTTPGTGLVDRNTGVAGAAGNRNQAVASTAANAPQPAKGANSFSRGEAVRRIEREGYTKVADIKKDRDGIWRGRGMKDGADVGVWLDYKGNIGQQ